MEKIQNLITYITELAQLGTVPVRDVTQYDSVLWLSEIPHQKECRTIAWGVEEGHEAEWVRVERPREPPCPSIPEICDAWRLPDVPLTDKKTDPELLQTISVRQVNPEHKNNPELPKELSVTVLLSDHPEVSDAWRDYVETEWRPWKKAHDDYAEVQRVYSQLFLMYQEQRRQAEEYELVLGVGLLKWSTGAGPQHILRHLVVADVDLEFETKQGRFVLKPADAGIKLRPEFDMLGAADLSARLEVKANEGLATCSTPWARSDMDGVLKTIVHSLSDKGGYVPGLELPKAGFNEVPIVTFAPAVILRKRNCRGLLGALQQMSIQLEDPNLVVSEPFGDITEQPSDTIGTGKEGENKSAGKSSCDDELYFPKVSNEQQKRIARQLEKSNGVLVQGPPGTGKSHAIANLICHLLATGKRLLITAKTPKALQVLHGLLPEGIQPLCVSLLGDGLEERKSLGKSIHGILDRHGKYVEECESLEKCRQGIDGRHNEYEGERPQDIDEKIATHTAKLHELRSEKTKKRNQLREVRKAEIHSEVVVPGVYEGTAAEIAKSVREKETEYGWFSDVVDIGRPIPIDCGRVLSILESLRYFSTDLRNELALKFSSLSITMQDFEELIKSEKEADATIAKYAPDKTLNAISESFAGVSETLLLELRNEVVALQKASSVVRNKNGTYPWLKSVISDTAVGTDQVWHTLLSETEAPLKILEETVDAFDRLPVQVPESSDWRTIRDDATIICEHLSSGASLGWGVFQPKKIKSRRYILKKIKIHNRICSSLSDFESLRKVAQYRVSCRKLCSLWNKQIRSEGGTTTHLLSEESRPSEFGTLRDVLQCGVGLKKHYDVCRRKLEVANSGFEIDWQKHEEMNVLANALELARAISQKRNILGQINTATDRLNALLEKPNIHPVMRQSLEALERRDASGYDEASQKIGRLEEDCRKLDEHTRTLAGFASLFPVLAQALQETANESFWDLRIRNLSRVLDWRRAKRWVEEYVGRDDASALEQRLKQIENEILDQLSAVAKLKSWNVCFSKIENRHCEAMRAWQLEMGSITATGAGKMDGFFRQQARKHLETCREIIPSLVMPLHRVWDSVDIKPKSFDVIIVDEASQCGFEAFPLFYLADKIVIVGDDKQISPEHVGVPLGDVQQLINAYLGGFIQQSIFNIGSSLFDQGKVHYTGITLQEHFRCMPEIIRFSNELCYSDAPLLPMRQYGRDRLPPLLHHYVEDGYTQGTGSGITNENEAEELCNEIKEICGNPVYKGKSIGVIVLQGTEQAKLIERRLLSKIGVAEMTRRNIVCGEPSVLQGSERDVILLSLVASSERAGGGRIGVLSTQHRYHQQRFNVAASRAKDQMILFHSVKLEDLSPNCLRHRLLAFFMQVEIPSAGVDEQPASSTGAVNRSIMKAPHPYDSWFEVDVAEAIRQKGFTVIPQYLVIGYRIDLVVVGGTQRIAVECDGDCWHGEEQYNADMFRQRQLERCGWVFVRIRYSEFCYNGEKSLEHLWRTLKEYGISPFVAQQEPCECEASSSSQEKDEEADLVVPDDQPETQEQSIGDRRNVADIGTAEIRTAIIESLSECTNNSCMESALPKKVLVHLGVRTRGQPLKDFSKRVAKCVLYLDQRGRVERYKAVNKRVRLLKGPVQLEFAAVAG